MNRYAGVLLSVTSLPSKYGIGCFDQAAYDFVDWLEKRDNVLFGATVYPQQILFVVSAVTLVLLAVFFLPTLSRPARVDQMKQS